MRGWQFLLWVSITVIPGIFSQAKAKTECTSVLSVNTMNYGQLTRRSIDSSLERGDVLTSKQTTLTVNCSQPTRLRVYFAGNRDEAVFFRFGKAAAFRMKAEDATVDAKEVQLLSFHQGKQPKLANAGIQQSIKPGDQLLFIQNGELKGSSFSLQLTVQPVISHRVFQVRDQTQLEASVNIITEPQD